MATAHAIAAHDGILRLASDEPDVHRPLVLVDPPMRGRDVANLQRALHERFKARGLADDVPVAVHGRFTPGTALACVDAAYVLVDSSTQLVGKVVAHDVTPTSS